MTKTGWPKKTYGYKLSKTEEWRQVFSPYFFKRFSPCPNMSTLVPPPQFRVKKCQQRTLRGLVVTAACLSFLGCAGQPASENEASASAAASESKSTQGDMRFIDIQSFDQRLGQSLGSGVESVSVTFYDRLTPSQLPDRLQKWMAAVEANGGKVNVQQPPSSTGMTAKSPFLVVSGLVSLWSAKKALDEIQRKREFTSAGKYDAVIRLVPDSAGNHFIQTITFNKRAGP